MKLPIALPCVFAALVFSSCERPQDNSSTLTATITQLRANNAALEACLKALETRVAELNSLSSSNAAEPAGDDDVDLTNVDVTKLTYDELKDPADLQDDFASLLQRSTSLREEIRLFSTTGGDLARPLPQSTTREAEETFAGEIKATNLFRQMATEVRFSHDSLKAIVHLREQLLDSNAKLRAALEGAKK